jgi:hypothetical protein
LRPSSSSCLQNKTRKSFAPSLKSLSPRPTTYSCLTDPRFKRSICNNNKTPPCGQIHDAATTAGTPTTTSTDVLLEPNPHSISATAAAAATISRVLSAGYYNIATQRFLQPTAATCACACGTSDSGAQFPKSHINNAAACVCKFTATAFAESRYACSAFATG